LTYTEYKDKLKQLENCIEIVRYCNRYDDIKNIFLVYDRLDNKNPNLKKKMINTKVENILLVVVQNKNFNKPIC